MKTDGEVIQNGKRYITMSEAQKIYGVSRRTLYNWMYAGKVESGCGPGGTRYIAVDSLALNIDFPVRDDAPRETKPFLS